jgi:hypothetical protein
VSQQQGPGPHDGEPPITGLSAVDEAVARLADLDRRPVSEHHEALTAAHEVLHTELQSSSGRSDD